MIGLELAVEQGEAARLQPRDQPGERHFGGIARARHHRFAEKGAPQRQPIKPADQPALLPAFDRMGMALPVEFQEHLLDRLADPGFGPVRLGFGAQADDAREIGIGGHAEFFGDNGFAQRA